MITSYGENVSRAGACLCLSYLAAALPRDDEGDDEGVMCWFNGCSSNVFFSCTFFVFLLAASLFVFPLFTPSWRSTGEVYID